MDTLLALVVGIVCVLTDKALDWYIASRRRSNGPEIGTSKNDGPTPETPGG